jgi:hypothetical protein
VVTEQEEQWWLRGNRAAWLRLLGQCLINLGYDPKGQNRSREALIAEREEAIVQLRMTCDQHGDNNWPETLHLADVIEKHLARHLEER